MANAIKSRKWLLDVQNLLDGIDNVVGLRDGVQLQRLGVGHRHIGTLKHQIKGEHVEIRSTIHLTRITFRNDANCADDEHKSTNSPVTLTAGASK